MEADKQSLEALYARMGADELTGIEPDKLTDTGKEVFAAELARRGISLPSPQPAVYEVKHLFRISPALRAKHFWDFFILRALYVLLAIGVCFWVYMLFTLAVKGNAVIASAISIPIIVLSFTVMCGLWRVRFWSCILLITAHIVIGAYAILQWGLNSIQPAEIFIFSLTLLSAVCAWRVKETLDGNAPKNKEEKSHTILESTNLGIQKSNTPNNTENITKKKSLAMPTLVGLSILIIMIGAGIYANLSPIPPKSSLTIILI